MNYWVTELCIQLGLHQLQHQEICKVKKKKKKKNVGGKEIADHVSNTDFAWVEHSRDDNSI